MAQGTSESNGRLLTPSEVQSLLGEFQEELAREMQMQEELVGLQIRGSDDQVMQAQARHDELVKEIGRLRRTRMLPLVKKVAAFVAQCQELEGQDAEG